MSIRATLKTNRMQLVAGSDRDQDRRRVDRRRLRAGQLVIGTGALSGATGVLATLALSPTRPARYRARCLRCQACRVGCRIRDRHRGAGGVSQQRRQRRSSAGLTVGTSGTDVILGTTSITSAAR